MQAPSNKRHARSFCQTDVVQHMGTIVHLNLIIISIIIVITIVTGMTSAAANIMLRVVMVTTGMVESMNGC